MGCSLLEKRVKQIEFLRVQVADLQAIIDKQAKIIQRLTEALEFYARDDLLQSPSEGFEAQYDPAPAPIEQDRGERARRALAAVGRSEGNNVRN